MGDYGFYTKHHYLGDGDRYPGDALIDAANEAIDLRAENERLRDELRTTVERYEAMKARSKEAIALWRGENKRLREALRDLADAYRGIALDHPTVVTRHLPLIRAEEVLFGSATASDE